MNLTSEQQAIADLEVFKYKHVWENCETYNDKHHDLDLVKRINWREQGIDFPLSGGSVIALGCGDGSLVRHLDYLDYISFGVDIYSHPFWAKPVQQKRNGIARRMFQKQCLWENLPTPGTALNWDMFVCADVLEHIPETLLDQVLRNIKNHCIAGIFQVANMGSRFDGYELHLIKENVAWWLDRIQCVMGGIVKEIDDPGAPKSRFVIYWERE